MCYFVRIGLFIVNIIQAEIDGHGPFILECHALTLVRRLHTASQDLWQFKSRTKTMLVNSNLEICATDFLS